MDRWFTRVSPPPGMSRLSSLDPDPPATAGRPLKAILAFGGEGLEFSVPGHFQGYPKSPPGVLV